VGVTGVAVAPPPGLVGVWYLLGVCSGWWSSLGGGGFSAWLILSSSVKSARERVNLQRQRQLQLTPLRTVQRSTAHPRDG
jgi:hypothetical protein